MTRTSMNSAVRPPTPPEPPPDRKRVSASGIAATMPAKMISDEPLPIPESVISSPSHMMTTVPVVMVSTVSRWKPSPGFATTSAPPLDRLSTYEAATQDWTTAMTTVPYRVSWLIRRLPCSPSLLSWSSLGITTVSSCITIDEVTYGMMPSVKIENCWSAPPENMLNMPRNEPVPPRVTTWFISTRFTPGTVMNTPTRYTARMNNVNKIRRRSSGTLPMFTIELATWSCL